MDGERMHLTAQSNKINAYAQDRPCCEIDIVPSLLVTYICLAASVNSGMLLAETQVPYASNSGNTWNQWLKLWNLEVEHCSHE